MFVKYLPAFLLFSIFCFCAGDDIFSHQPRIISIGGHLIIQAAEDRNITLKSIGKGSVRVNENDLAAIAKSVKQAVKDLDDMKHGDLVELELKLNKITTQVNSIDSFEDRLSKLENDVNGLRSVVRNVTRRNIRLNRGLWRLRTRFGRLRTTVTNMRTLLTTDECISNPCRNGGTCEDGYNGYICRCSENWQGITCEEDVNECGLYSGTPRGCQNGAACVNILGSFQCLCTANWHGILCTSNHDDCSGSSNEALCGHGTCYNLDRVEAGKAKYTCVCDVGWKNDGTSNPACVVDEDECSWLRFPCAHNVQCLNTQGSYMCGHCPLGFTGNGHTCNDINECLVNNGGCMFGVQCTNTPGSRTCGSCPLGYQGDGITCTQVGMCSVSNGGCSPIATCTQISGGRQCQCPLGYVGSGEGPFGCTSQSGQTGPPILQQPCQTNPCVHGTCSAHGTSYHCACQFGFTGVNCELEVNECLSNPCQNGGICADGWLGFTCACGAGFTGIFCELGQQACGDQFHAIAGTLKYPIIEGQEYEHSLKCEWTIETDWDKVLNLTFIKFDLENNCNYDFLQINEGLDTVIHTIGQYCGTELPNKGTIVTAHNKVQLLLQTDTSHAGFGFTMFWNSTNPICGGSLYAEHGFIESPGYPGKYPVNRDCYWSVAVTPGKKILFHFRTVKLEHHETCDYDSLTIRDGYFETDPAIGTYCSTMDPAPLMTSSSYAYLHFHSDDSFTDFGFQITYSAVPGIAGCGGVFTHPQDVIYSPVHPTTGNYHENLHCDWQIRVMEGERIKLFFTKMDLEEELDCAYDYVQVYDGRDAHSRSYPKHCGQKIPDPVISTTNYLFIQFYADGSNSHTGFQAEYEIICGGVYTDLTGTIHSPLHPDPYPHLRECIYIIGVPPGLAIVLEFEDFVVEGDYSSDVDCHFDYVQVRDGDDESSPLLGHLCGEKSPEPIISTHNYMWIKFKTDDSVSNKGFLANYRTEDVECGGIFINSTSGVIISPGHPLPYPHDKLCRWIIRAPAYHVIVLTFDSFLLENGGCYYDHVEIFDNVTSANGTGHSLGQYCGDKLPPSKTTLSNTMTIVFQSDSSSNFDGFSASYQTFNSSSMCRGNYFSTFGVIRSPNYPENYPDYADCTWTIQVPSGQQIELNITDLDIEENGDCYYDFLEIRNGGQSTSPLIGKFCTGKFPNIIKSLTNQLYIHFQTDDSVNYKGFQLYWDGTSIGCGGLLNAVSGEITSPNYPFHYSHHAFCEWTIAINEGMRVRIFINDIDMEDNCNYDFLEIHNGNRGPESIIQRLCGKILPEKPFITKSNKAVILFRTDSLENGRGFSLRYESDCNNEITRGRSGVIESANYPNPYPSHQNCTWTINAPWGSRVHLIFSSMDMESTENCEFDFVAITENVHPYKSLGKFCNRTAPPNPITSESEGLRINFQSDGDYELNGFRLEWTILGCGGEYYKSEGTFSSPTQLLPRILCEWMITVDYGYRVNLTIDKFDLEFSSNCDKNSMAVFGSFDPNATALTTLCHRSNTPQILTSTGNRMLIRYKRDVAVIGSGFSVSWSSVEGGCGGEYNVPAGTITSPNYPQNYKSNDDCSWLITVAPFHTVLLNFTDFELETYPDCVYDYVKVFDGDSEDSNLLFVGCSNSTPEPHIVRTSSNKMFVRFKSDHVHEMRGFAASYITDCGGTLNANDGGIISISETSNMYSPYSNCSWKITADNPGDHVTLTITELHIHNYELENDCSEVYLRVIEGDNKNGPRIGTYCDLQVPAPITSQGSALFVILMRGPVGYAESITFTASYFESSSGCGANYTSESGSFSSPGYPNNYPSGIDCYWTIKAPPGNRAQLSFTSFDIEQSDENCHTDYLEIHETNAAGKLLGVYCGTNIPFNLTSVETYWMKFHSSDETDGGVGFMAQYKLKYGNEIFGTEGQIASPLYPRFSIKSDSYKWHVVVPSGMRVQVTFEEFIYRPANKYITLYDGSNENSPVLDNFRGADLPDPVYTYGNELTIVFPSTISSRSRFLLTWKAIIEVPQTGPGFSTWSWWEWTTPLPGCGAHEFVPENNITNISSPGFPEGYSSNLNCRWILETAAGNHLSLKIVTLDLAGYNHYYCYSDYIQLYDDQMGTESWSHQTSFCKRSDEGSYFNTTGHRLRLEFRSDYWSNGSGFLVQVQPECGGYVYDKSGVITSPGYPNNYPKSKSCEWFIRLKPGRKYTVQFEDMDIESVASCADDYILLRDGENKLAAPLGTGQYCGTQKPSTLESVNNNLYIKFVSDNKGNNRGFKLLYEEVSLGCSGTILLSTDSPSRSIQTPNFPLIPPPHSECEWIIMTPSGHRVELNFNEIFKITDENNCSTEYVAVYDGGTTYSTSLLHSCGSIAPPTVWSTGNTMLVKFFTDTANEGAGFKAEAKIAICGGKFVSDKGMIFSPNHPLAYGNNLNCEWFIQGPSGHYLTFTIIQSELPYHYNCSEVDHIQIRDYNATGEVLGTFCDSPYYEESVDTSDMFGYVNFKSFQNSYNFKGFQLKYNASIEECGGEVTTDTGVIASPNFPQHYPHHRACSWTIRVKQGRRIRLIFTDFDLEERSLYYNSQWYCGDYIMIFDSYTRDATYLTMGVCGHEVPPPFESSSNVMVVRFYSDGDNAGTGFRAEYTSSEPALCGGEITAFPGNISSLIGGNYGSRPLICQWEMNIDSSTSIVFTFRDFNMSRSFDGVCYRDFVMISRGPTFEQSTTEYLLCGNLTEQKSFVVPSGNTYFRFKRQLDSNITNGFNVTYNISQCGGEVSGDELAITSPNYPRNYGHNTHCAWLISVEEGNQIKLKFDDFDLDANSNDYVVIYNGRSPHQTPKLGIFNNTNKPRDIHSMSNYLWVEFHSDNDGASKGFKATSYADSSGCGGIYHGDTGIIKSFNFPDQYPHDLVCYWEVIIPSGYHLNISFVERFDIQADQSCSKDFVGVYEKIGSEWQQIGSNFCGKQIPSPMKSTVNHINITFRSDGSINGDGFKAMWHKTCGGVFREPSGVIYSPGFPDKYDNGLVCEYLIETDSQHYVRIDFDPTTFDLENSTDCKWDSVEIFDGNSSLAKGSGKYCHSVAPDPHVSKGAILIRFASDYSVRGNGFVINYVVQECGGNITNSSGIIRSPTHPHTYLPDSDCYWTIEGTAGLTLSLHFNEMQLEYHYSCRYDFVAIFDGDSVASPSLGRFCGYNMPDRILSSSNIMTVHFHTDDIVHYGGFVAFFQSTYGAKQGCGGLKNTSFGSFSSVKPAGSQEYAADLSCEWNIVLPNAEKVVKIEFESFDIENPHPEHGCTWDYLEIRDGESKSSPLIDRLCGNTIPLDITSSSHTLWVKFISDSSHNKAGFRATFTSVDRECGGVLEVMNTTTELKSPQHPSNYPLNKRCVWTLTVENNLGIQIQFDEFDLEESTLCTKDYFEFKTLSQYWYSPHDEGRFCGSNLPHHFHSVGHNSVQVTFVSDSSNAKKGFKLRYRTGICNVTYDADNGRIIGQMSYASANSGCLINITTEETRTISLYITAVQFRWSSNCSEQVLKIYDGNFTESSLVDFTCSYSSNPIFSTGRKMFLYYKGEVQRWGANYFDVTYTTTDKGRGCGGLLSGSAGALSSPLYPSNYSVDAECKWLIQVSSANTVRLSFRIVDIYVESIDCESNYVAIYDGSDDNDNSQLGKYCGRPWVRDLISTKSSMLIKFVSNTNNTGSGFYAYYNANPWQESEQKVLPKEDD